MFQCRPARLLMVLLTAICLTIPGISPAYGTKQDVEDAKKKASSLEAEKKKVEDTLKKLEGLKKDAAAYVRELDNSISQLNLELEELDGKINDKEQDIEAAGQELEAAKQVEAAQYDAMKLRIKYMYERGETTYLDMLLQSEDLIQMMNRAEYIQQIAEYDRKKMGEYEEAREAVVAREAQLNQEREQLLLLQEQTEGKQHSVETLLAQKNQELKNFESQIHTAEGQISEYEKDIRAQEEEEARKAAEAAGKKYNTVNLGDIKFIWPCPASSRITSSFGSRTSPTPGASSNHQGMDIGAPSGSSIVAAASGTVVIATYSYSAGNYIMVNHGGGVYTVYMHCSQLLASEGQDVIQGQTIAKVGSTGYSTGPHLHFGIRANGKYVDPGNYVSP